MLSRVALRRLPTGRRAYSSTLPQLPSDPESWKKAFLTQGTNIRDRVSVRNPETAAKLANAFVPDGEKDRVIVEAFPGPGALTRALLELPHDRIRKIVVLEDHEPYLDALRPLERDSRVTIVPKTGHAWTTYQDLHKDHMSDVPAHPWEAGLHPTLQFISHIPHSILGEQLVAQFCRCVPDKSWLFQHGRVPMNLIITDWLSQRVTATVNDPKTRCKVSVMAEAVAELSNAVPPEALAPYSEHWHPIPGLTVQHSTRRTENRKVGQPMVALSIHPRANQFIRQGMLDKWDFVLRKMFVTKSTSLEKSVRNLAPGADDLLERIRNRLDVTRQVRHVPVEDWAILCDAFDEWPFAPDDLLIADAFSREE